MLFKKHPHKRKYKFIDKKQQLRFAFDVALHSLLFPITLLLLSITPPFSLILVGDDAKTTHLLRSFLGFCVDNWHVVVLALICVGFYSVLFSHRIFGPIRRFENALNDKIDDAKQPIRCNLRTADYFHEFSLKLEKVLNQGCASQDSKAQASNRQG